LNDNITLTPYEVENDKEIKDCDICQRDIDSSTEKTYNIRCYHGQISEIIHACSNCYKNKEQEYLQNYECIFSFPGNDRKLLKNIKLGKIACYAGKKDSNGKILQQQNCSHCQP
jgi:transposase